MPKIGPFEKYVNRYEEWFVKNRWAYKAELRAIEAMVPRTGKGMEVGVGTGLFAKPLGIRVGIEPSERMGQFALRRGIKVVGGVAEQLPFNDCQFDFVLMVTTLCFVDDPEKSLLETYRILSPGGFLVIGFVDRDSKVGQIYLKHQEESIFYKEATFFSVHELILLMGQAGFTDMNFNQTIFRTLPEIKEHEPVKSGYGEGSFVVIRGRKV